MIKQIIHFKNGNDATYNIYLNLTSLPSKRETEKTDVLGVEIEIKRIDNY